MPYRRWRSRALGPSPLVRIQLVGPSQVPVPTFGLVDSGADDTCFPLDIAKLLGIEINQDCDEVDVLTAGGRAREYHWRAGQINGIVLGRLIELPGRFSATPVTLLGQSDFFEVFKVSFDRRGLTFRLEAY